MDDELDYDEVEIGDDSAEDEFMEFVSRLSERNRTRQIRESIERIEESRKIRDQLGLDGFDLGVNY